MGQREYEYKHSSLLVDGAKLYESKKSSNIPYITSARWCQNMVATSSDVIKHFFKKCDIDEVMVRVSLFRNPERLSIVVENLCI